jgi:hypothetical protein
MAADPTIFAQRFENQRLNKNHPYRILIQQNKYGTGTEDRLVQIEGWLPEEITFDVSAQYEAPYAQGLNQSLPVIGQLSRALGVNLTTQAMTAQVWQGSTDINFQIPIVFQAETDAYRDVIEPVLNLLKLTMPIDSVGGGLLEAPGPHIDIDRLERSITDTVKTLTPGPQQEKQIKEKIVGALGSIDAFARSFIDAAGDASDYLASLKNNTLGTLLKTGVKGAKFSQKAANEGAVAVNTALVNSIVNNISLYVGDFLYFPSVVITDVSQAYNILIAPDNNPSRATVNVTFRTFYIPTQRDLDIMFQQRGPTSGNARKIEEVGGV